MTRAEHLEWCKKRALEYLDRGDVKNAVTSMLSDMDKHEETKLKPGSVHSIRRPNGSSNQLDIL